jgi:hypothetical protein
VGRVSSEAEAIVAPTFDLFTYVVGNAAVEETSSATSNARWGLAVEDGGDPAGAQDVDAAS